MLVINEPALSLNVVRRTAWPLLSYYIMKYWIHFISKFIKGKKMLISCFVFNLFVLPTDQSKTLLTLE